MNFKLIFLLPLFISAQSFGSAFDDNTTLFNQIDGMSMRVERSIIIPNGSKSINFASWKVGSVLNSNDISDYISKINEEIYSGQNIPNVTLCFFDNSMPDRVYLTPGQTLKLDTGWGISGYRFKTDRCKNSQSNLCQDEFEIHCLETYIETEYVCSNKRRVRSLSYRSPKLSQVKRLLNGYFSIRW